MQTQATDYKATWQAAYNKRLDTEQRMKWAHTKLNLTSKASDETAYNMACDAYDLAVQDEQHAMEEYRVASGYEPRPCLCGKVHSSTSSA